MTDLTELLPPLHDDELADEPPETRVVYRHLGALIRDVVTAPPAGPAAEAWRARVREAIDRQRVDRGVDRHLDRVLEAAALLAPLDIDVLLTGPAGTGKAMLARAIHDRSPRAGGRFVALACAAIPAASIEDELFGTEPGAHGRVALAAGGTLFLDEVDELSAAVVTRLLELRANVRLVAATSATLAEQRFPAMAPIEVPGFVTGAIDAAGVRTAAAPHTLTLDAATRGFQRGFLLEALERHDWNVGTCASELGLARAQLDTLIDALDVTRKTRG